VQIDPESTARFATQGGIRMALRTVTVDGMGPQDGQHALLDVIAIDNRLDQPANHSMDADGRRKPRDQVEVASPLAAQDGEPLRKASGLLISSWLAGIELVGQSIKLGFLVHVMSFAPSPIVSRNGVSGKAGWFIPYMTIRFEGQSVHTA
jgi:hypothetical protein